MADILTAVAAILAACTPLGWMVLAFVKHFTRKPRRRKRKPSKKPRTRRPRKRKPPPDASDPPGLNG